MTARLRPALKTFVSGFIWNSTGPHGRADARLCSQLAGPHPQPLDFFRYRQSQAAQGPRPSRADGPSVVGLAPSDTALSVPQPVVVQLVLGAAETLREAVETTPLDLGP